MPMCQKQKGKQRRKAASQQQALRTFSSRCVYLASASRDQHRVYMVGNQSHSDHMLVVLGKSLITMFCWIIWVGNVPNIATFCRQGAGRQVFFLTKKKNFTAFISALIGALVVTGATDP